jgi:hypothetical protein
MQKSTSAVKSFAGDRALGPESAAIAQTPLGIGSISAARCRPSIKRRNGPELAIAKAMIRGAWGMGKRAPIARLAERVVQHGQQPLGGLAQVLVVELSVEEKLAQAVR